MRRRSQPADHEEDYQKVSWKYSQTSDNEKLLVRIEIEEIILGDQQEEVRDTFWKAENKPPEGLFELRQIC